jgi:uncharacterized membrane protein
MSDNPYQQPEAVLVDGRTGLREPSPSVLAMANLVYALHTLSIIIGVVGAATIIGAFLFSIPSIIAVIINYVKQPEASGTFVASHFRWQIRTFWFGMLWGLIGGLVFVLFWWVLGLGIVLGAMIWGLAGLWLIYRIVRGWLALREGKPMYV